ncbi:MAG: TIM barrel protein [Verrucomicrobiota bacterium]
MAIAADLGYDGYEFHPVEPQDDKTWEEISTSFKASGLKRTGMYVVTKGATDEEFPKIEAEIARMKQIIDRLAALHPQAYLNFTVGSNPVGKTTPDYRDAGSAHAEPRHWERTARIVREIDTHLALRGLSGNIYNHVWFMTDTPAAVLRTLQESGAKVVRPGLASFHAFFHLGVLDMDQVMALPGMERLSYYALLNGWPKPADPFRTRPLDDGNIDFAGALGSSGSMATKARWFRKRLTSAAILMIRRVAQSTTFARFMHVSSRIRPLIRMPRNPLPIRFGPD